MGETYRFRVLAINEAGVGHASLPSEPVIAQTQPGKLLDKLYKLKFLCVCNNRKTAHLFVVFDEFLKRNKRS